MCLQRKAHTMAHGCRKWTSVFNVSAVSDLQITLQRWPELNLHAVRFGSQSDSIHWCVVWFSCILRPDELKLSQQSHHDDEELHSSQTLSKTHARTCNIKTFLLMLMQLWKSKFYTVCCAPIPAEKGMKASGLTNSPWSLRKFSGLNSCGNFHCPSSFESEVRLGIISVPWGEN